MEVRAGYKQTEVGVIPEDWDVKPILDIISLMTNGFVGTVKSHYTESDEGIIYIQGYNVEENSFNFHGIKRITHEFHNQHSKSCLQEGDLLTVQTGDIGVTTVIPKELEGANCHALIITRFIKRKADPRFYCYYFNFSIGRRRLKEIETGSTMKHINGGDMKQMLMPYPSKAEQTAIATVLSDADTLISSLEKLITKKRNIKQGAMQKLLQPKDGWEVKILSTILKSIQLGGNYSNSEKITNYPLIKMGNIQRGYISTHKVEYITNCVPEKKDKLNYGDILFNTRNTLELVGKISVWRDELPEAYFNSNLMRLEFNSEFVSSNLFMNYLLNTELFIGKLKDIATGTTSVAAIYTRDLKKLEISLPSLSEQIRIANILSDMDAEISALETKLDKYRNIKLGMMQNLLTGKIRLV